MAQRTRLIDQLPTMKQRLLICIDARNSKWGSPISLTVAVRYLLKVRSAPMRSASDQANVRPVPSAPSLSDCTRFEEACIARSGVHVMALARALKFVGAVDRVEQWHFLTCASDALAHLWQPLACRARNHAGEKWWVCNPHGLSRALSTYLEREENQPSVLLVAGTVEYGKMLPGILQACRHSFKVSYPLSWAPWLKEDVTQGLFDLYLVDEPKIIEEMKQRVPHARAIEYPKQVDYVATFFPMHNVEKEYDFVVSGVVCQAKGQDMVIRAASALQHRYGAKLRCCFVGVERFEKGWQAGLEHMARDEGVDATFTGQVLRDEVNLYLNRSRVGVIASWWEVAPRTMLEYMAADIPVVVNARLKSGLKYLLPDVGVIAEPENMADAMWSVLKNRQRFRPRETLVREFGASALELCARSIFDNMIIAGSKPRDHGSV